MDYDYYSMALIIGWFYTVFWLILLVLSAFSMGALVYIERTETRQDPFTGAATPLTESEIETLRAECLRLSYTTLVEFLAALMLLLGVMQHAGFLILFYIVYGLLNTCVTILYQFFLTFKSNGITRRRNLMVTVICCTLFSTGIKVIVLYYLFQHYLELQLYR